MEPKLLTRWQIAKVVSLKRDGTPSKLTNGRATLPLAHYLRNAERTQMSAIQRVKSEAVDADGALRAWVALDDHEEFVDWPGSESGHGALKAFVRQFLIG